MSARFVVRFVGAVAAMVIVIWLGHGRIPEAAVNGLAFTALFLIMPLSLDRNATRSVPLARRVSGALLGGAVVALIYYVSGGWHF